MVRWRVVPLEPREIEDLRGADIGNVLAEARLFGVSSHYSRQIEDIERRIGQLRQKGDAGDRLTAEERDQLLEDVGTLKRLATRNDQQRGEGSFLSDAARLQERLLSDLAREIDRAERS